MYINRSLLGNGSVFSRPPNIFPENTSMVCHFPLQKLCFQHKCQADTEILPQTAFGGRSGRSPFFGSGCQLLEPALSCHIPSPSQNSCQTDIAPAPEPCRAHVPLSYLPRGWSCWYQITKNGSRNSNSGLIWQPGLKGRHSPPHPAFLGHPNLPLGLLGTHRVKAFSICNWCTSCFLFKGVLLIVRNN